MHNTKSSADFDAVDPVAKAARWLPPRRPAKA